MTAVVQSIAGSAQPWAAIYSASRWVSSGVMFLHLGGLLLGGGGAVVADRASLRAVSAPPVQQSSHLRELALTHRIVIMGLLETFVSGVLLALSDVETFATLWIFWFKMGLVGLLLLNGYAMQRTERALATGRDVWKNLHRTAIVSLALWFVVVLVSTFLTSA